MEAACNFLCDDVCVTCAEHLLQLPLKESINKDLCCAVRRHEMLPTCLEWTNQSWPGIVLVLFRATRLSRSCDLFVPVSASEFWSIIRSGFRRIQGAVSVIGVWQLSLSVSYSRHHVGHAERPQFVAAALFVALGSVVLSPRLVSTFSFCLRLFNFPLV